MNANFRYWLSVLLLFAGLVLSAEPFADEWNFYGEKFYGNVKTIVETHPEAVYTMHFDLQGRLVKREVRGTKTGKFYSILHYNQDNTIAYIARFLPGQIRAEYVEYATYHQGRLRKIRREGNTPLESSMILLYPNGKVKQITMQTGGKFWDWCYEFDAGGFIKKAVILADSWPKSTAEYRCDERGNVIFAERFGGNAKSAGIIRNAYEFDKRGNWVVKLSGFGMRNTNAAPDKITRTITYY